MGWAETLDAWAHLLDDDKKAKKALRDGERAKQGTYETGFEGKGPNLLKSTQDTEEDEPHKRGPLSTNLRRELQVKYTKERTFDIDKTFDKLMEEYDELVTLRLIGRPLNVSFSRPIKSLQEVYNSVRDIPTEEELKAFISTVNRAARYPVAEDKEDYLEQTFKPLVEAVNGLEAALDLMPKLTIQDEKLTANPFDAHDDITPILNELGDLYDTQRKKDFFKRLGIKNKHALNKDRWERIYNALTKDLDLLIGLKPIYENLNYMIQSAQKQCDLPTKEELSDFKTYIFNNFTKESQKSTPSKRLYTFSPRYQKLMSLVLALQNARQERIDEKKRQAQMLFDTVTDDFVRWRAQIDAFKTELAELDGEMSFPWASFPPSAKEVDTAKQKVLVCKKELEDWPDASTIFTDESMVLEDHEFILERMQELGLQKIDEAFNVTAYKEKHGKELPYKTLQAWIENYKYFLLNKVVEPKAQQIINDMELKLFFYAHRQIKNNQWCGLFGFFKRSKWEKGKQVGWSEIVSHVNGDSKGYSGNRSTKTLKLLGWMNEMGECSEKNTPSEFKQSRQRYDIAQARAKSTFTNKTAVI